MVEKVKQTILSFKEMNDTHVTYYRSKVKPCNGFVLLIAQNVDRIRALFSWETQDHSCLLYYSWGAVSISSALLLNGVLLILMSWLEPGACYGCITLDNSMHVCMSEWQYCASPPRSRPSLHEYGCHWQIQSWSYMHTYMPLIRTYQYHLTLSQKYMIKLIQVSSLLLLRREDLCIKPTYTT